MDDIWQELYNIADFDGHSDPDNDGLINLIESISWSDPHSSASASSFVNIVDIEPADGLDDFWQAKHGIYPDPADPLDISQPEKIADPDGDGRTNLEESIVGSDPFTEDSPWQQSPAGAGLGSAGSDSFTLSLGQTAPSMRYQLQSSEDLVTWTTLWWEEFEGDGSPWALTLDTTGISRQFYRFILDQPDDDSDGLINWHEWILGTSVYDADSDFDGLDDGWEVAHGLNALEPDTDGDGVNDRAEVDANTNPNSADSHPPVWRSIARDLAYDFYQYADNPEYNTGGLSVTASWDSGLDSYQTLTSTIALTALTAHFAQTPFSATLPAISTPGLQDSHAYGWVGLGPPVCPHATIQQRRCWLTVKPAPTQAVQQTAFVLTKRTINGVDSTPLVRMVTVTIPANQTTSDSVDLVTYLTVDAVGNEAQSEYCAETLVPELFVDNRNVPYTSGMEALGVSNYVTTAGLPQDSNFGDVVEDPENFRLQARLANTTTESVEMTLEVIRDGATVAIFNYTLDQKLGDKVRGRFLRLVSDTNDDAASGAGAASDPNNQTILVKLGDKLKASYDITPGNKVEREIPVGRPSAENDNAASHKKHDIREVKIRCVVFQNAAGQPCVTQVQVDQDIADANERLAPTGVRINATFEFGGPAGGGVPLPAGLQDGFDGSAGFLNAPTADETAAADAKDNDVNTVDVFYVEKLNTNGGRGVSFPKIRNMTGDAKYDNWIVISAVTAGGLDPLSLPHELLHILLNEGHRDGEPATALFRAATPSTKDVGGAKRIGPYPDATSTGVGVTDTSVIRQNAESLP